LISCRLLRVTIKEIGRQKQRGGQKNQVKVQGEIADLSKEGVQTDDD